MAKKPATHKELKRKESLRKFLAIFWFQFVVQFIVLCIFRPEIWGSDAYTNFMTPVKDSILHYIWIRDGVDIPYIDNNIRVYIYLFFENYGNELWFRLLKAVIYFGPLAGVLYNLARLGIHRLGKKVDLTSALPGAAGAPMHYAKRAQSTTDKLIQESHKANKIINGDAGLWFGHFLKNSKDPEQEQFLFWQPVPGENYKVIKFHRDFAGETHTYEFRLIGNQAYKITYGDPDDPNDRTERADPLDPYDPHIIGFIDPETNATERHFTVTWLGGISV